VQTVKTLASRSFFRTFDLLLAAANPSLKLSCWSQDGVACVRERHSFGGGTYNFAVEVVTMTRPGCQGWTLVVVKEFWWSGDREKELRSTRWAQLLSGRRNDAIAWMRKQEERLDREPGPSATATACGAV
jgi:hypothetical protein